MGKTSVTSATVGRLISLAASRDFNSRNFHISIINGKLGIQYFTGSVVLNFESNAAVNFNQWQHIAVSYENQQVKFYINGVLEDTATLPFTIVADFRTFSVALGAGSSANPSFKGSLSELRIYNVVKNDADILRDHNRYLVGNEANLVYYNKLNENGRIQNQENYSGSFSNYFRLVANIDPNIASNSTDHPDAHFVNYIGTYYAIQLFNGGQFSEAKLILTMGQATAVSKNIAVNLDASGTASITPSNVDDGSVICNGVPILSIDTSTFDCNDVNLSNAQRALSFQPGAQGVNLAKRI